ncbi:MAG: hypothetical protein ACRD15_21490 [Vicinamibacterales bacterium]
MRASNGLHERGSPSSGYFMLRSGFAGTTGGVPATELIRSTAAGLNSAAAVSAWPLSDDLREYLEPARLGAGVAWTIGLLGLLLSRVGVFGLFAYSVEERRCDAIDRPLVQRAAVTSPSTAA